LYSNVHIKNGLNTCDVLELVWNFCFHSVARQCYTVVRATHQVNEKWQFWGYQNSVTPEPID